MISEEELAELALWWRDKPESSTMRLVAEVRALQAEVERLRGLIFDDSPVTPEEEAWARSVVEDGG